MKKALVLLAAGLVALALSGCANQPTNIQTPAQIAARVCPPVKAAITSLQQVQGLDAGLVQKLNDAQPVVDAACSAGSTVTNLDLKGLATQALPVVQAVVNASPLADDVKQKVGIDLSVAQIVLASVLASLPADASGVASQ